MGSLLLTLAGSGPTTYDSYGGKTATILTVAFLPIHLADPVNGNGRWGSLTAEASTSSKP